MSSQNWELLMLAVAFTCFVCGVIVGRETKNDD